MGINEFQDFKQAICLISGGLDSPIAAYFAIKRGINPIAVFFDSHNNDSRPRELVEAIVGVLARYHEEKRLLLITIPYGKAISEIVQKGHSKFICLHCKRFMLDIAENIAQSENISGIITGEIMGEQASQTTLNLAVTGFNRKIPILRPLIGLDKNEILVKAREIGTYFDNTRSIPGCSYVPKKPSIGEIPRIVMQDEAKIGFTKLISQSLKLSIRKWIPASTPN